MLGNIEVQISSLSRVPVKSAVRKLLPQIWHRQEDPKPTCSRHAGARRGLLPATFPHPACWHSLNRRLQPIVARGARQPSALFYCRQRSRRRVVPRVPKRWNARTHAPRAWTRRGRHGNAVDRDVAAHERVRPHRCGPLPEIPGATYLVCGVSPESQEGTALLDQAHRLGVA